MKTLTTKKLNIGFFLLVFVFLFSIFYFLPASADAAGLVPCDTAVPGGPGKQCTLNDLLQLLVNIYNYMLGLAGIVALLFIIWGGIRMFYFGFMEDSSGELSQAKDTVRYAITGIVIIATAYLVVNTLIFVLSGNTFAGLVNGLLQGVGLNPVIE